MGDFFTRRGVIRPSSIRTFRTNRYQTRTGGLCLLLDQPRPPIRDRIVITAPVRSSLILSIGFSMDLLTSSIIRRGGVVLPDLRLINPI